ncbi:efflux RND transporter permease subunit [Parabacteroides sp. PF5-6]|uniref:efflux RND transporter permease subunit n=1 Tax=Parabacteroides sp. PF5-6 TaxID=1742403 RepID=UPI002406C8B2|nr:efflux RND transporter permease subunit [Parabacteroides sp. PF5-6]MDF9830044.1 HAE1 family hydrophobic/amphiphilic exporter-1 [Parabacteroides sp. PF5-6]
MRSLVRFAVNNPVTITMVVLAVLLLGKISYDQLSVDLLPDLNNPRLFIEVKAGERPPEEIEKQFVRNIESMAIRQSDVTEVSSVIKAGSARITVEYAWSKDMDEAFLDLQKAMNTFARNDEIEELKITQYDPNQSPVILVAMSHQNITDMAELRKVAESYIRNELIRLEGVAEVELSGQESGTLTIHTDPYRLAAFNLTIDDIASKIEANNQSVSGGRVTELGLQYLVKSATMFSSEADFENLIVGYRPVTAQETATATATATAANAPIYLREVANVSFVNARPENIVRINGERSIGLSVYKEMRFNTVRVVDAVDKQLAVIENALPGYRFQVITNQGTFIRKAIDEVQESAVLGVILAVIVLFVFLRRVGTTLIVSIAIPISIVATFNLMFFNGLTLNIMTLGGLALGAGMLIDNAIVVIESIFRNQEKGADTHEAAVTGTAEVGGAIIASTLTTVVVFLPIVYLHGATGELFKDQAWTVSFSLLSSLIVAIGVIPMLYYWVGKRRKEAVREVKSIEMKWYSPLLRQLLQHRWLVVGIAAGLIVLTGLLIPFIGTEFMPRAESKTFTINVKMAEGTQLERTASAVANLEDLLATITEDPGLVVYSHIGTGSNAENAVFEGEHTAMLKVILSPQCQLTPETVIAHFVQTAENPDGLELTIGQDENSLSSLLGNESAPIVVEVKGEELDEIATITEEVKSRMLNVDGLYNIMSSIEDGAPEITISIDRTVAGINNLSVSTVIEQIRQQLSGREAGQMEYRGEMRDIVIKLPDIGLRELGALTIKSGEKTFRLQEIARLEETQAPKEIFRRNQHRISKVTANMEGSYSLDKMAQQIRQSLSDVELPLNYTVTVTGEEEKRQESMNSLLFALILSVILVYMVLASQFESLLHPFTILLTIPLAVVGAILLFFLTGTTINMMGFIGIVMLVGIAVNNSIILVDRINQLKQGGMELTEAIVEAGQQRIRPIIMTSLTTILALLPMAFSFGEGSSLRTPMAIAVVGGLVTSTLMSLMVIPCVYFLLEKMKEMLIKRNAK